MTRMLTRRSLLEGSLGASLGIVSGGSPWGRRHDAFEESIQVPADSFNVNQFGAKGDGSTDDSQAFQKAITAAARAGGIVIVPASTRKYVLGSPLILAPNIAIRGTRGRNPTLRFAGRDEALFKFVGSSEAEELNVTLSRLILESGSVGTGTAVRTRNFSGLFLRHVAINHFDVALRADWGIGVHLYGCSIAHNSRGLEVGGAGPAGGIRGGDRHSDAFMDTTVVDTCAFAQNGLDINDMGSTRSLGAITIRDSSFFEAYTQPVPTKRVYVRIANRKGITVSGNWFEGGRPARTCLYLGDYDHNGNHLGTCRGAAVFGNDFLQTGATDTIGVDVASCDGATIFGNCFEFSAGNDPIRLASTVGISTIGHNSYVTYPDRPGYANPIAGGVPG